MKSKLDVLVEVLKAHEDDNISRSDLDKLIIKHTGVISATSKSDYRQALEGLGIIEGDGWRFKLIKD